MLKFLSVCLLFVITSVPVFAEEYEEHDAKLMEHGEGHLMDMAGGMVMGNNPDKLPGGCESISETKEITVHAGHKYAEKFPGRMYAFDTQELNFKPCTKLTVHFINDDHVRHQWMMHGLPKYLYPKGMFHLEASGPSKISGTLILPPGDKTYLVHCDIAQHMEKGMKAQLKVGKGDGDLPSIPGVTSYTYPDDYKATLPELELKAKTEALKSESPVASTATPAPAPASSAPPPAPASSAPPPASVKEQAKSVMENEPVISGVTLVGVALGMLIAPLWTSRFKGMTASEIVTWIFEGLTIVFGQIIKLLSALLDRFNAKKTKVLPEK